MAERTMKVIGRFGGYQKVAEVDLVGLLSSDAMLVDVHHVNAVVELADNRLTPIIERAIRCSDHLVVRAASRAAVTMKIQSLVPLLREAQKRLDNALSTALVNAAIEYLSNADRGLSLIKSNHPQAMYLITNLLAVREFDKADLALALGSFMCASSMDIYLLPSEDGRRWVNSLMPDSINALARALEQCLDRDWVTKDELVQLHAAIAVLKGSGGFSRLDRVAREELAVVEQLL
ncbi:MAG TPA: hypothetical protein VF796_21180 [Humisphaera sp.]